jgi:hypothetical protein
MLTGAGVHIDSGEVSICGRRVHIELLPYLSPTQN